MTLPPSETITWSNPTIPNGREADGVVRNDELEAGPGAEFVREDPAEVVRSMVVEEPEEELGQVELHVDQDLEVHPVSRDHPLKGM